MAEDGLAVRSSPGGSVGDLDHQVARGLGGDAGGAANGQHAQSAAITMAVSRRIIRVSSP